MASQAASDAGSSASVLRSAGVDLSAVPEVMMLAFLVHERPNPPLNRGECILPISHWQTIKGPLHVLRRSADGSARRKFSYMTLLKLPEDHPVAVIVGEVEYRTSELLFHRLNALPQEDRQLLNESFRRLAEGPAASLSLDWIARLVLGVGLSPKTVKWTKDIRLLEGGHRNPATKRT